MGLGAVAYANRDELRYLYECRGEIVDLIKQKRLEYQRRNQQHQVSPQPFGVTTSEDSYYYELDSQHDKAGDEKSSSSINGVYTGSTEQYHDPENELRHRSNLIYDREEDDFTLHHPSASEISIPSEPELSYNSTPNNERTYSVGSNNEWVRPNSPFWEGSSFSEISTPSASDDNEDYYINRQYSSEEEEENHRQTDNVTAYRYRLQRATR